MKLTKRTKLVSGALAVLAVGGLIGGGIAWAAIAPPPVPLEPTDTMYACVSSAGKVKGGTLKLNVAPTTCPSATDTVRSWNPQQTDGPVVGLSTLHETHGLEFRYPTSNSDPRNTWVTLPDSTLSLVASNPSQVLVHFDGFTECTGVDPSRVWMRFVIDGAPIEPEARIMLTLPGTVPERAREQVAFDRLIPTLEVGEHAISTEIFIPVGGGCTVETYQVIATIQPA